MYIDIRPLERNVKASRQTVRQAGKQINTQVGRQSDRQGGRNTDRQIDGQADIHTCTYRQASR